MRLDEHMWLRYRTVGPFRLGGYSRLTACHPILHEHPTSSRLLCVIYTVTHTLPDSTNRIAHNNAGRTSSNLRPRLHPTTPLDPRNLPRKHITFKASSYNSNHNGSSSSSRCLVPRSNFLHPRKRHRNLGSRGTKAILHIPL